MLSLLLACRADPPLAPPPAPIPDGPEPVEVVLDNGVRVTLLRNPEPPDIQQWALWVDAGGRMDPPGRGGVAHFVEHMAFNGTRRFPGNALIAWMEDRGVPFAGDQDAWTTADATVYRLRIHSTDAELTSAVPGILRDWVDGVTFDPAEVERERGVVLSELVQRRTEMIEEVTGDASVGGSSDSVGAITRDDLVSFYRTWYRPDRVRVVAVGDLDPVAAEGQLRATLGQLTAPPDPVPDPAPVPADTKPDPPGERTGESGLFPPPWAPGGGKPHVRFVQPPEGIGGEVPVAPVWTASLRSGPFEPAEEGAALILSEVLRRRLPRGSSVASIVGQHVVAAISVVATEGSAVERLLANLAPTRSVTAAEFEYARTRVLVGWADRPFARTSAESTAWLGHLLDPDVATVSPFAADRALHGAVQETTAPAVQAVAARVLGWDAVRLTAMEPEIPEPRIEAAFRAGDRPRTPEVRAVPDGLPVGTIAPLPVEGASAWRMGNGGQALVWTDPTAPVVRLAVQLPMWGDPAGQLRSAQALVAADGAWLDALTGGDPGIDATVTSAESHLLIRERILPDRVDDALLRLADLLERQAEDPALAIDGLAGPGHLSMVAFGPIVAEAFGSALARSVAGLPAGAPPRPRAPARLTSRGSVIRMPGQVIASWTRPLRDPADRAQLDLVGGAISLEARGRIREALGAAYSPEIEVVIAQTEPITVDLKVRVPCPPGRETEVRDAIVGLVAALKSTPLSPTLHARAVRLVSFEDPRDPDPGMATETLLRRLRIRDDMVAAWSVPAPTPLDPEALRALAEVYLTELLTDEVLGLPFP